MYNGLVHRLCFELTGTLLHGPRDYYNMRSRECDMRYAMRMRYGLRECDMRIRYGPRNCDMHYANVLWAARMRYAIREYAVGRANAMCDNADTRIGYARYANTLWAARIRYGRTMRYAIRE